MTKYTFDDLKIGDQIITTSNEIGTIIALKSYAYLNDKMLRKANQTNQIVVEMMPFHNDNTKHDDVWYSCVTISVEDKIKSTYYIEAIDLIEIKEVLHHKKHTNIFDKIKNFLHII